MAIKPHARKTAGSNPWSLASRFACQPIKMCSPIPMTHSLFGEPTALPAKQGGPPHQPRAEPRHDHVVARFHAFVGDGLVQGERDGRRGSVAVAVDVGINLLTIDAEHVDGRVNDANIGLM